VEQAEMERRMFHLRGDLASMGEVDQALVKEARDTETRYAFLKKESEDLEKAVADLTGLMAELTQKIASEFERSLKKINEEFEKFFALMFGGGIAKLKVESPKVKVKAETEEGTVVEESDEQEDNRSDLGVEIDVRLPRKKISSLDMLSGGERSLVGIAALFALISVSPPPFLVLDEIDAPLDERNARRFAEMLKDFSKHTQFVVVTHNRATMESADILYGVTLNEDGTSKILSLKLEPVA
jgi:chromosome segregation protein